MQCCGSRRGPSSNGSRGQAAVAEFEGRVAALENQLQGPQGEAVVDASVTLKRGGGDAETNGMRARGKLIVRYLNAIEQLRTQNGDEEDVSFTIVIDDDGVPVATAAELEALPAPASSAREGGATTLAHAAAETVPGGGVAAHTAPAHTAPASASAPASPAQPASPGVAGDALRCRCPSVQIQISIDGQLVAITAEPGIDVTKAVKHKAFMDWTRAIEQDALLTCRKVHFQGVDMFGSRVGSTTADTGICCTPLILVGVSTGQGRGASAA